MFTSSFRGWAGSRVLHRLSLAACLKLTGDFSLKNYSVPLMFGRVSLQHETPPLLFQCAYRTVQ